MKNAERRELTEKTGKALEQIAMKACYTLETRGGLEDRDNDQEDFTRRSAFIRFG